MKKTFTLALFLGFLTLVQAQVPEIDMVFVKGQLKIHDGYFTSDKEQISEIKEQMRKSNRIIKKKAKKAFQDV